MIYTVAELADHIQGEVIGDGAQPIDLAAPIETANRGSITFAETQPILKRYESSPASCAIVPHAITTSAKTIIRVDNPRVAFAKIMRLYYPERRPPDGIHPFSVMGRDVKLGDHVSIGSHVVIGDRVELGHQVIVGPGTIIQDDVVIGDKTVIDGNITIYRRSVVGARCIIHAGSVIGADGFGFVQDGTQYAKIPQVGNVIIEDDVELGANVTIDRGTIGSTVLKQGVKIDNMCHVAHNVQIGEHTAFAAMVGIAGSTKIGKHCVFGGKVGIADHVTIDDQVIIGGAGIVPAGKHLRGPGTYWGVPARPIDEVKKQIATASRLPQMAQQLKAIQRELDELRKLSQQPT